jgi:hypothetical protein
MSPRVFVADRQCAFFEGNGDPRAVGDAAGDEGAASARFEFAPEEALQGPRAVVWLTFAMCGVCFTRNELPREKFNQEINTTVVTFVSCCCPVGFAKRPFYVAQREDR